MVEEAEVEDEYIDDTLEDLEDLDQYRLKIDLNEFTVDNPDLPDPILKKPMEFSWARAVSEEEKCQARGEAAPQYSGPVEVVWYDELDGERGKEPQSNPKAAAETEAKAPEMASVPEEEAVAFHEKSQQEIEGGEISDFQKDKASRCEGNDDPETMNSSNDTIQDVKEGVDGNQNEEESFDIVKQENETSNTCINNDRNDTENNSVEDVKEKIDNTRNEEESSDSVKDGQRENERSNACTNNDPNGSIEDAKKGTSNEEESSDSVKNDQCENEEIKNDASSSTPDVPTDNSKVEVAESNSVKNDVSDSGTILESDHVCSDK